MKYGMNLLLWTTDVSESQYGLLEQVKSWGFDGVELPVFNMNAANFERVGGKLDELGMERTAVTVCSAETNPISPSPEVREAGLNHLKQAIDMCAAVGATHLCGPLHSALGEFSGQGPTEEERSRCRDVLTQAADHAEQAGVTLAVEYLNRFECYLFNCAEETAHFTREIGHPHLKMMYDSFHANIEEKSVARAISTCADQLVHVHVSENDRSTPGEGNVDWDATFEALKEIDYEGWLTVEAFGLALPELAAATKIWRKMFPSEEHVATRGLEFMKSRWEEE